MTYLISVDCGMAQTKYAYVHPTTGMIQVNLFQTICSDYDENVLERSDCVVTYGGKTSVIGDHQNDLEIPNETNKLTPRHQLCIYTAIAKSLMQLGAPLGQTLSVSLCLNVPLEDFRIQTKREEYQRTYQGQNVEIEVNGQLVRFIIDRVNLNYEGQGAIFHAAQHNDNLKEGLVTMIDIGGFNDTTVSLRNLKPIPNSNRGMMNGVLRMFYNVACELSQHSRNGLLTTSDIERMSKGIHEFKAEGFEEVYERKAKELVVNIKRNVMNNVQNPHQTHFLFSGGGSQALAKQIQEAFGDYNVMILEESQFDNCIGMLEFAIYSEKSRS